MKLKSVLALAVTVSMLGSEADASLVGDQISVRISIPNISGFDQTQVTTVTADASDVLTFSNGGSIMITVDPFASGFALTQNSESGVNVGSGSVFEFTNLDFTPAADVTGVSYIHNWFFVNAGTSFTTNSASVDFTGNSSFGNGHVMTVNLETTPVATVPTVSEWGLAALTFLLLMGGVLVVRRSKARS